MLVTPTPLLFSLEVGKIEKKKKKKKKKKKHILILSLGCFI
jgi:hypothetical protein